LGLSRRHEPDCGLARHAGYAFDQPLAVEDVSGS
jgi:hypothetical protein